MAALRCIKLSLTGTCTASVPVPEPRLRFALQYLLSTLIEAARPNCEITLVLEEGSSESVLRVECEHARLRDDRVRGPLIPAGFGQRNAGQGQAGNCQPGVGNGGRISGHCG